jgi:hypothetical protein
VFPYRRPPSANLFRLNVPSSSQTAEESLPVMPVSTQAPKAQPASELSNSVNAIGVRSAQTDNPLSVTASPELVVALRFLATLPEPFRGIADELGRCGCGACR